MPRKIIAIIGDAVTEAGGVKEQMAYAAGKAIIDAGYRLQCGGMGGVMRAACKGARSSAKYKEGDIIGIIPSFDERICNEYVDIPIATGLDMYRNLIVANASAVVAVGGGSGTLCELASAWALKRLIIAFANCPGTSEKMANERPDTRIRYPEIPEDKVYGVTSAEELAALLQKYLPQYNNRHTGIVIA